MGRYMGKLNSIAISKAKSPGYYGDGDGLWLQIAKGGSKSWVFRFTLKGKRREMGLGPLQTIGLADARKTAQE
ncbi:MAG: Arm DNA-binding domain-containing protein [Methylocystis sp.]